MSVMNGSEWSVGEMILTGKRTCPTATSSTADLTRTGVRMSPCLHGERQATDSLISDQNRSLCRQILNLF